MPALNQRATVAPISGEPSPYGLLGSCVDVVVSTDMHELNGTQFTSTSCNQAHAWQDCPAGTFVNPVAKTFDRPGTCTFEPITMQAGVECSTFGLTYAEARARAAEQLRLGEQRGLEDWFMRNVLCVNAVDLTPAAGALHIAQGVGVLESWLGSEYGGQGTIHAPIGTAALMSMHHLVNCGGCDGSCPATLAGSGVVLGAGYAANVGPDGAGGCTAAPAGEAWLYITPPVRVRRDSAIITPDTEGASVNIRTNDRRVMAESTFVVELACCNDTIGAVRVSLSACP